MKYMREIIEALNKLKGKAVDIYTEHKLFGKQHIQMDLEPETEIGLGFRCRDQVIYIDTDDVVDYCVGDNKITINGSRMSISVVVMV